MEFLKTIKNIYFLGIGGIGMSAIARYFHQMGMNVSGYDKFPTKLTDELISEDILITFDDEIESIPVAFQNREETLIVRTPAIPNNSIQKQFFENNQFHIKKRAEVLGMITAQTFCLAVAGTHGKTTTSSMLAHIMFDGGTDVTAFMGGVLENYQTNLIGRGKTISVVEADEFDRSFLHLHPNIACVISTDADHLDIYENNANIKASFQAFADKITDHSKLFVAENIGIQGTTVGFSENADIKIKNVRVENHQMVFDLQFPNEIIEHIQLQMPGNHNILNASLAFAMAYEYGLSATQIKKSLADFKGVRRRFSFKLKTDQIVYIDDYAHHPTEINAVYQAVSQLYPNKKVFAVFQPHLFSRTRDFMDDFAKALSQFQHIALLDIYPARELPIVGITSHALLEKITAKQKVLLNKDNLLAYINQNNFDILLTICAGDIGEMTELIKENLIQKC